MQEGESTKSGKINDVSLALVDTIAKNCNINGFNPNQLEACHRTSANPLSPIIMKFKDMHHRWVFFSQKKNLTGKTGPVLGYNLTEKQIEDWEKEDDDGQQSTTGRGRGGYTGGNARRKKRKIWRDEVSNEVSYPYVSIAENLTDLNFVLLN